jgi:hypothetical protein
MSNLQLFVYRAVNESGRFHRLPLFLYLDGLRKATTLADTIPDGHYTSRNNGKA